MDEINLLELIKRRFAALQANRQADSDLPAVFMRARRVLEIIVLDI
jgi:hypothetical protein